MTATLMAVLVDQGALAWSVTPSVLFSEWKSSIHPSLRNITLEQLLSHRAGIQPFEEDDEVDAVPLWTGNPMEMRRFFAEWILARGAASPVGKYVYSNAGYGLAAAFAERATGQAWESLMQARLFQPLGMTSAGFGRPSRKHPNQPWGHYERDEGYEPQSPRDGYPLSPFIAPAGDVHMSVMDLAHFARVHLAGLRGESSLVGAATFEKLHQPIGEYALGWNAQTIEGLPASTHSGSAGTFYAGVIVYPPKNIAIVVAINASGPRVEQARNRLFSVLLRRFGAIPP
jgi:CubicO group peptidase (beta-lactamase class C family)